MATPVLEHTLRDDADYSRHCDYIHYNPVKHGFCATPVEWPWSTFRRFVSRGAYPLDWAVDTGTLTGVGRE